jgi:putative phosphoribosyl transferase
MRVAIHAARNAAPAAVVVASPVIPPDTARELSAGADAVIACATPDDLGSIGEWYDDFAQLTDNEARAALAG